MVVTISPMAEDSWGCGYPGPLSFYLEIWPFQTFGPVVTRTCPSHWPSSPPPPTPCINNITKKSYLHNTTVSSNVTLWTCKNHQTCPSCNTVIWYLLTWVLSVCCKWYSSQLTHYIIIMFFILYCTTRLSLGNTKIGFVTFNLERLILKPRSGDNRNKVVEEKKSCQSVGELCWKLDRRQLMSEFYLYRRSTRLSFWNRILGISVQSSVLGLLLSEERWNEAVDRGEIWQRYKQSQLEQRLAPAGAVRWHI